MFAANICVLRSADIMCQSTLRDVGRAAGTNLYRFIVSLLSTPKSAFGYDALLLQCMRRKIQGQTAEKHSVAE